jgi:lysophospholipase L1-like esterase
LDVLQLSPGATVLFQGDSITDGNRGRTSDPNHILGHGYVFIIAAKSGAAHPEKNWTFINRGISGNKVSDLAARWQTDAIDLKPDVLSILIGINDIEGGTSMEDFKSTYDKLLTDTQLALPHVHLVLCEPFAAAAGSRKAIYSARKPKMIEMQGIVRALAAKHHAIFVPLQVPFDVAMRKATPEYWIWDGIHPTYSGHQILADAWVNAVNDEMRAYRR